MQVRWGAVCITGNFRENNEDRCLTDAGGRYFFVADGMGGQSAGEKASELATQIVPRQLGELMSGPDPEKGRRVMQAMLGMRKIDIAGLKRAYEGT